MCSSDLADAIEFRLCDELSAVITQPDLKQRVLDLDFDTFGNTREAIRAFL